MELHQAVAQGEFSTVEHLIASGADVNARDEDEYTPLMHAAKHALANVVRILLSAGADVDATYPATGIQDELEDEDFELEDLVDEQEVVEDDDDIDAHFEDEEEYDERGIVSTALSMAIESDAEEHRVLEVIDLLLSAGADSNFADEVGRSPLMSAAALQRVELVRRLLAAGAKVNATSSIGATALHFALADDDDRESVVTIVRELVAFGANPDCSDNRGRTPFMLAARLGLVDLLREWIQQVADPDATDSKGCNALAYTFQTLATITRDPEPKYDPQEVREGLEQLRIDLNSKLGEQAMQAYTQSRREPTPLELVMSGAESAEEFESTRNNSIRWLNEAVDLLLALGCSLESSSRYLAKAGRVDLIGRVSPETLNLIDEECGQTALTEAVADGQVERVRQLLDAGADPNARNYYGDVPLMCAEATRRGFECAELLIAAGADLNAENENGLTVIEYALIMCQSKKIPFLLDSGADPRKGIPLLWALTREMSEEFQMLLEHGADPNASLGVDNAHHFQEYLRGTTAFMRACADRPIEVLQRMLDAGADLAAADREGQTAVGIALRFGRQDVAAWLLEKDAKAPSGTGYGATLLDAAERGNVAVVAECLARGADPDYAGDRGFTPLIVAAREGHTKIVNALLGEGAHVDSATDYELTPLRCAVAKGHTEIVRRLVQSGADVRPVYRFVCAKKISNTWGSSLHDASRIGADEIIDILLTAGADVDAVDEHDWTPLVVAIREQRWHTAEYLLAAGAKRRKEDAAYWAQLRFSDKAAQPAFAESIAQMERLCGVTAQRQANVPGMVSLVVSPDAPRPGGRGDDVWKRQQVWSQQYADKTWRLLDAGYEDCLARGHLVLHTGHITLLPTDDKFAALTLFNIGTNEDPMDTPRIVAGLRKLDKDQPFRLRGCNKRRICIEFSTPLSNPDEVARRLTDIHYGLGENFNSRVAFSRYVANQPRLDLSWD